MPSTRRGKGKCDKHAAVGRKRQDAIRGSSTMRGYDQQHVLRFRAAVLRRANYLCECGNTADTADHYPIERKRLVEMGADPNDPDHGRALCSSCHNRHTAKSHNVGGDWR